MAPARPTSAARPPTSAAAIQPPTRKTRGRIEVAAEYRSPRSVPLPGRLPPDGPAFKQLDAQAREEGGGGHVGWPQRIQTIGLTCGRWAREGVANVHGMAGACEW